MMKKTKQGMRIPRLVSKLEGGGHKGRRRRAKRRPAYCCEWRVQRVEGGENDLRIIRGGMFSYPETR